MVLHPVAKIKVINYTPSFKLATENYYTEKQNIRL